MNRLERLLAGWNFKKIAVWYLIFAVVAGLACAAAVGYLYRERLSFAWQYAHLEDALQGGDETALRAAIDRTAEVSGDVTNILLLDGGNHVTYCAKSPALAGSVFSLTRAENDRKYLVSAEHPDAVFQYVKRDEFMLHSILSRDFGEIQETYDDDSFFDSSLSSRTVYMLSCIRRHGGDAKIYVISVPTSVPGGMTALKATAALAMLFFGIYWVLVALWMYRDAAGRKLSPVYWGLIGLMTNVAGLLVYQLYKRSLSVCGACGAAQSAAHLYCSRCGAQLGARCSGCGGRIGPKDRFCPHCGKQKQ